ncbi:MAG TPA: FtsX-like permease family protein [Actinomycetota bacterium]|nr:FtsX-like permease family protein [Actinomycetota bacterium]
MRRVGFWLRWSGRELRRRWHQVAVTALVIAIGTGVWAGLGSTGAWRIGSYTASFERLSMHDLRVVLQPGSFASAGSLSDALRRMDHPGWVDVAEERLLTSTQVDASTGGRTILVRGRLVGVDVSGGGPHVDALQGTGGRTLAPVDGGSAVALLEDHFAEYHELPASGRLTLAGGRTVRYVGTALTPEYFIVNDEATVMSWMAESSFAVVFMPLASAQAVSGHEGSVNDLVLRLVDGVDPEAARDEVERAFAAALPELGVTVKTMAEDPSYEMLFGDAESDRGTMNALAALVLAAAVFAAFNLTSRIVEAQRREIGIGMALGVRRWGLAIRPLVIGAEIAVLGVVFGIGMGWLVGRAMSAAINDMLPMPVWETPFQAGRFAGAAVLGFVLPLLATAWPVWRAVRVPPVDAIRTGHLAARGGGLAPLVKRLPLPGGTFGQLPLRNVLRAPRRTIVTALGMGAAIAAMIGFVGLLDSLNATLDRGEREAVQDQPERATVELDGFVRLDAEVVTAVRAAEPVARAEPVLRFPGMLTVRGTEIAAVVEVLDLQSPIWHPSLVQRAPADGLPSIVLAEKAAEDLDVTAGDAVVLRHPRPTGPDVFEIASTRLRVVGVHPGPLRPLAFVEIADAEALGLGGIANGLQVIPAPGASVGDVQRSLFEVPGVASVQSVDTTVVVLRDLIERFAGIIQAVEVFVALLALLVAFNAASINVDERAREHATMFAFGLRPRTLLRMTGCEGLLVGSASAAVGVGIGILALGLILQVAVADSPEVGVIRALAPGTILLAVGIGVVAAVAAAVLTGRRLRRMDVPSTLRVME